MKKILIISPSFPPVNAADMHRVRQSVSYFTLFGYTPIVVCVESKFCESNLDPVLCETLPTSLEVHRIRAFSTRLTRILGLGSLALRSMYFYKKFVDIYLKNNKVDLIYFSTTMFPIMILGAHWKKNFGIPYVIDMQDPWHTDNYLHKPKNERPPKFWFSYRLNKFLEPIAMKQCSGIISVSDGYLNTLQQRYSNITNNNCITIPFGAFAKDFEIANKLFSNDICTKTNKNGIYIGRGGTDMHRSLRILFNAIKIGSERNPDLFENLILTFTGTSYALAGTGKKTIEPLANEMGLNNIAEFTDRIPYFEGLDKIQRADFCIIPGSDDPMYTASKIYPYILSKRPIFAIFHESSSAGTILDNTKAGTVITFGEYDPDPDFVYKKLNDFLQKIPFTPDTDWKAFEPYTALEMTRKQAMFFDKILNQI